LVSLAAGVVLTGLALTGCGSDGDGGAGGSSGGGATTCEQDTRKDVYIAGLSKQAPLFSVKLVESTPAPPAKGTNAVTLQLVDAGGKPLDGLVVAVTPFMPDHGHGSAVTPVVTALGDGKYRVEKIYYPMAGLWRLTVTVTQPTAAPQEVTFQFCLEG